MFCVPLPKMVFRWYLRIWCEILRWIRLFELFKAFVYSRYKFATPLGTPLNCNYANRSAPSDISSLLERNKRKNATGFTVGISNSTEISAVSMNCFDRVCVFFCPVVQLYFCCHICKLLIFIHFGFIYVLLCLSAAGFWIRVKKKKKNGLGHCMAYGSGKLPIAERAKQRYCCCCGTVCPIFAYWFGYHKPRLNCAYIYFSSRIFDAWKCTSSPKAYIAVFFTKCQFLEGKSARHARCVTFKDIVKKFFFVWKKVYRMSQTLLLRFRIIKLNICNNILDHHW